jgi:hypothetical protein
LPLTVTQRNIRREERELAIFTDWGMEGGGGSKIY